jgi:hypothetical protein
MRVHVLACALLVLAASEEPLQEHRKPLHERRKRPSRNKSARQQAAAARARARGWHEKDEAPRDAAAEENRAAPAVAEARDTPLVTITYTPAQRAAAPSLEKVYRAARTRACASECARTVYAQHLRKAGGTLLRQYLARYRCRPFTSVVSKLQRVAAKGVARARTAHTVVQGEHAFNPQNLILRPHAVYVTILRDPVHRVASAYFAEGGRDFERWLEGVLGESRRRSTAAEAFHDRGGTWPLVQPLREEVADYYVQVFSGVAAHPVTLRHVHAAQATLDAFDVVLILEHLGTPDGRKEAMRLLERALPLPETAPCPPSIRPRPVHGGHTGALTVDQRRRVEALNVHDLTLYEHAVRLMNERLAAVAPPCGMIQNCSAAPASHLNLLSGEDALDSCGRLIPRKCRG